MVIFSKRFEKDFEVDAIEQNGQKIARFQGLKTLLDELGSAVTVAVTPVIEAPVYGFEVVIADDTGNVARAYGSVNVNAENGIPRQFALETAYSRALSGAVIEYFGFADRVYGDVAIKPEETVEKTIEPDETAEIDVSDGNIVVDEQPDATKFKPKPVAKYAPAKAADNDPGEFKITFGKTMNGKKIKELTQGQIEWLAGDGFDPRSNKAGVAAKAAAKEFLKNEVKEELK